MGDTSGKKTKKLNTKPATLASVLAGTVLGGSILALGNGELQEAQGEAQMKSLNNVSKIALAENAHKTQAQIEVEQSTATQQIQKGQTWKEWSRALGGAAGGLSAFSAALRMRRKRPEQNGESPEESPRR